MVVRCVGRRAGHQVGYGMVGYGRVGRGTLPGGERSLCWREGIVDVWL